MSKTELELPEGDENYTFKYYDRPVEDHRSITYQLQKSEYQAELDESRPPNTIHFSGFWECPRSLLKKAYGHPFTDWTFRWSNREAAKNGDKVHELVQAQLVRSGMVAKLPSFVENPAQRVMERDMGFLQDAIEVSLDRYLSPYTAHQRQLYEEMGVNPPAEEAFNELMAHRLGGRLDSILRFPGYPHDVPVEIKTVYPKYWVGEKSEQYMYGPEGKWIHYIFQLQLQLHFWRDSVTGERPKFGVIYLINRGDTSLRQEKVVWYDPKFVEIWLPVIKEIKEAWDNGEILEGRPTESGCKFCEYNSDCDHPNKFPKFVDWNAIRKNKQRREEEQQAYYNSLA
jgi:CRISPR/Cas system-associated exonuclease Cas4 (RecB family)